MMDCTDRHFRYLLRCITTHTVLYTEMVTAPAILCGDADRLLAFSDRERPLVLQLGGDDPQKLARCAKLAEERGYLELNLNVGCPSPRVQSGNFGVCLMRRPSVVAACVSAMRDATSLPVTVKHRIGVDEHDSFEALCEFVGTVARAGCDGFIVHARKAWLHGLSPRENRNVPPLLPEVVYRLKRQFPRLRVEYNGGVADLCEARTHLAHTDGVMIGRAVRDRPMRLAQADPILFGQPPLVESAHQVVTAYAPYVARRLDRGARPVALVRPLHRLFAGRPGARAWRRELDSVIRQLAHQGAGARAEVLLQRAAGKVRPEEATIPLAPPRPAC